MKMMFNFLLVIFVFYSILSSSHQAPCVQSKVDSIPVISQFKSLFQVISGDTECAKETQETFVDKIEDTIDKTPIIGHVKGAVHLATGDTERGKQIMKDATKELAVGAGRVLGPVAAVAGGLLYDGVVSAVDSAVNNEPLPYGVIKTLTDGIEGKISVGEVFDVGVGLVHDSEIIPIGKRN